MSDSRKADLWGNPSRAPASPFSHKIYYRNLVIRRGVILPRFRFILQSSQEMTG